MSRLTRDGAAEPVSRNQILRRERGQENIAFPCSADHEQDWQPYPVDPYPCDMCDYIYTYIMVTTPYSNQQGSRSRQNPRWVQNHPRSSGTIRVKTISLGSNYSLHSLEGCPYFIFQNLNYKLQRRSCLICCSFTKVNKSYSKTSPSFSIPRHSEIKDYLVPRSIAVEALSWCS